MHLQLATVVRTDLVVTYFLYDAACYVYFTVQKYLYLSSNTSTLYLRQCAVHNSDLRCHTTRTQKCPNQSSAPNNSYILRVPLLDFST
jgi:hypothetical protein